LNCVAALVSINSTVFSVVYGCYRAKACVYYIIKDVADIYVTIIDALSVTVIISFQY